MNRRDLIVRHDLDLYNRAPREPHPLHRNPRVIRSSSTFGPSSRSTPPCPAAPSGGTRCSRRVGRTARRGRPACGRWIPSPAAYTRRSPGRQTTRARPCSLPLAPRDCPGRLLQTWRSPSGHVLGTLPQCTRGLLWRRRFLFFGFVDALEELRNLMKLIDIADHSQTRQCFSSRPIRYICRHHAH